MSRLNQNPLVEVPFNNFGGGYAGAKGASTLKSNEAQDLDNIVILPNGSGFRNRQGNKELDTNNFTAMNVYTDVVGLGTFKGSSEYLIWAVINSSDDIVVFDTVIGSGSGGLRVTMTGTFDQDDLITFFNFDDKVIGVGARQSPIYVTPGTSGTTLGGSPPAGNFGFAWNNRAWIGSTSANPSKLSYSILNDPEDWSSSGAGFVEPSAGDGDEITAAAPISNNVLLLFKKRTVYQVVGRSDPFAVFPLFNDTGCVGKHALVATEGLVYFITPDGEMKITDGAKIYDNKDIPALSSADDLWNQVPKSRLPYITGFRQTGDSFDWIVWMVSLGASQASNNYAIIWDLVNKCWLKCSTGYNGNAATKDSNGNHYIGGYDYGRVNQLDYTDWYVDDSQGTPTYDGSNKQVAPTDSPPVRWFWRSDDMSVDSLQNILQVQRLNILTNFENIGVLRVSYGYDGIHDQDSKLIDTGSDTFILGTSILGTGILGADKFQTKTIRPLGRGQTLNIKLAGSSDVKSTISKYTLAGSQKGVKDQQVR